MSKTRNTRTERQRNVGTLAHFIVKSGRDISERAEAIMVAGELMDVNAKLSYIGDWFEETFTDATGRKERRFWGDVWARVQELEARRTIQ